MKKDIKIGVIGLGYVGLPLAVSFAKKYSVIGYDINLHRTSALNNAEDNTKEVSKEELLAVLKPHSCGLDSLPEGLHSSGLVVTNKSSDISTCNVYIVTVPTPVDLCKRPDLTPLIEASKCVAQVLSLGDIVIFESTVYPGATEEDCVPVMERVSGMKFNRDFFVGYSPERINPGDKSNTFEKIIKVTSGSTPETADFIDDLYNTVLLNGTHKAPTIKVAEASKIIENCQRDLNISFVNELSLIFDRLGIDTNDVIDAAATKWNFQPYRPGLVGGHCIGVDPYYLKYKAEIEGYYPDVISSGRRVNNSMGLFVASKMLKLLIKRGYKVMGSRVLILGFTFKENCPDTRNTKIPDVVRELTEFGCEVDICDPWVSSKEAEAEYGVTVHSTINKETIYHGIILAVAHDLFKAIDFNYYKDHGAVIFDLKGQVNRQVIAARL